MYLQRTTSTLAILFAAGVFVGCSSDGGSSDTAAPSGETRNSILDTATQSGLTTFVQLAELSTFADVLGGTTEITVFAPDDEAFAALPVEKLNALRDPINQAELDALIGRSIVAGELPAATIAGLGTLAAVDGSSLQVDVLDSVIRIDGGVLSDSDAAPDNGILHTVDRVLEVPLSVLDELRGKGFGTFADLVVLAELQFDFNAAGTTVLAPTDAAFAALPAGELAALMDLANALTTRERVRTHLLVETAPISRLLDDVSHRNAAGDLIFVTSDGVSSPSANGVSVESFNLRTTTGLIHGLDAVLETPLTLDEALGDPALQTLETLIFASSLQPTLEQASEITVFAPDNDAFANLAPGAFDTLVQPMNIEILRTLLRSHVGASAHPFLTLADGDQISTLEGTTISVADPGTGALRLDASADFVTTDVFLKNGVLHVINAVLADDGL